VWYWCSTGLQQYRSNTRVHGCRSRSGVQRNRICKSVEVFRFSTLYSDKVVVQGYRGTVVIHEYNLYRSNTGVQEFYRVIVVQKYCRSTVIEHTFRSSGVVQDYRFTCTVHCNTSIVQVCRGMRVGCSTRIHNVVYVYNVYRRSTVLQMYRSSTVAMQVTWVAQLYWGSTGVLDISRVQDNRSSTRVHDCNSNTRVHGCRCVTGVQEYYRDTRVVE